jgi:hypothetical protein
MIFALGGGAREVGALRGSPQAAGLQVDVQVDAQCVRRLFVQWLVQPVACAAARQQRRRGRLPSGDYTEEVTVIELASVIVA